MHYPKINLNKYINDLQPIIYWYCGEKPPVSATIQWPKDINWNGKDILSKDKFIHVDKLIYFYDIISKRYFTANCSLGIIHAKKILQSTLPSIIAPQKYLHGVFLSIYGKGVLLQAPANTGKSRCALKLLSRGHKLICDDAPYFYTNNHSKLIGCSPKNIFGLLSIRGKGIVNISHHFGCRSLKPSHQLDLIIQLEGQNKINSQNIKTSYKIVLQTKVTTITIPLDLFTNAAMLVENAVYLYSKVAHEAQSI
jgi:serine kinase of HPr protein (carbohydrate metabolism regulator)